MMTKPYPMEMRQRAVRFVKAGESRHAVAKRLGVSVSCVVKWLLRHEATGSVKPGQVGGHRPRKIVGGHRDWVLGEIAAWGCYPSGPCRRSWPGRGAESRLPHHVELRAPRGQELQKKQFMGMSRQDLTFAGGVSDGGNIRTGLTSTAWSSSTRHGPRPTWPHCAVGERRASGWSPMCRMAIGKP